MQRQIKSNQTRSRHQNKKSPSSTELGESIMLTRKRMQESIDHISDKLNPVSLGIDLTDKTINYLRSEKFGRVDMKDRAPNEDKNERQQSGKVPILALLAGLGIGYLLLDRIGLRKNKGHSRSANLDRRENPPLEENRTLLEREIVQKTDSQFSSLKWQIPTALGAATMAGGAAVMASGLTYLVLQKNSGKSKNRSSG